MMISSTISRKRITSFHSFSIFFFLLIILIPSQNSFAVQALSNETNVAKLGKGVKLDGINDWIKIPDITLPNDFTIEGWVKLAQDIGTDDALFGQEGKGTDINFYQGKARLFSDGDKVAAKTALLPGIWGHIAITRSGKNLTLYVNGLRDATGTWDGILKLQALGRGNRGFFKGMIDEVRVWDVARTKTEIGTSFNASVTPNSPDLIAYWTFDNVAQIVTDISSSANHGSLGKNNSAGSDDPIFMDSAAPFTKNNSNTFIIMQSLSFESDQPSNKELMTNFGIRYLPEIGRGLAKNWNITNGASPFYDAPDKTLVREWASTTTAKTGFIRIEHLPFDFSDKWDDDLDPTTPLVNITDKDRDRAIQEMSSIVDWAHEANPELTIGYFGVLPQKEYWALVQPTKMHEKLNKLQQRNNKFKALATHVDIIFPTLYTFYHKPEEWKAYAKGMFQEARQYNKPIYAFIWPTYHPSNPDLGNELIPGDFWRMQLETLSELGYDGVVILGGDKKPWLPLSKADSSHWWNQTIEFMNNKNLLPTNSPFKSRK